MQTNTTDIPRASEEGEIPVGPIVGIILIQAVGTVIGNLMVCIAIYIQPALHHVTYHAIFSLALADLLAGLVAMPSYVAKKFVTKGPFYHFVCDAFRFSYFLTGYASILSLCVISVERMLAVKSPLTYMTTVTHARIIIALVVIWIDSVGISLLPFIPPPSGTNQECNYNPTSWWSIMVIISNVIMPFLFIVGCYAYIYVIARAHLDRITSERRSLRQALQSSTTHGKKRKERREHKANVTIMIVIGLFVVCWFPSSFYYFLDHVCSRCFSPAFASTRGIVNALVKILTFTSSFCNPIIYCWRSKDFRNAFIKILLRKTRNLTESIRSRSRSSTSQSETNTERKGEKLRKGLKSKVGGNMSEAHFPSTNTNTKLTTTTESQARETIHVAKLSPEDPCTVCLDGNTMEFTEAVLKSEIEKYTNTSLESVIGSRKSESSLDSVLEKLPCANKSSDSETSSGGNHECTTTDMKSAERETSGVKTDVKTEISSSLSKDVQMCSLDSNETSIAESKLNEEYIKIETIV